MSEKKPDEYTTMRDIYKQRMVSAEAEVERLRAENAAMQMHKSENCRNTYERGFQDGLAGNREALEQIKALATENVELRAALKGIVGNPENCLTFEGNLECRIYSTVDAYEAARKSIDDSEEPLDLGRKS